MRNSPRDGPLCTNGRAAGTRVQMSHALHYAHMRRGAGIRRSQAAACGVVHRSQVEVEAKS